MKVMSVLCHVCNNMCNVQHVSCKVGNHNDWVHHLVGDVWRK